MKIFLIRTAAAISIFIVSFMIYIISFNLQATPYRSEDQRLDKESFSLTEDQLLALIKAQRPIELKKSNDGAHQYYILTVVFEKQNADYYYFLDIQVTKYGNLLLENNYEKERMAFVKANKAGQYNLLYPDIGSRAKRSLLGFGPGGASEKILFSTVDKTLDIQVTLSHNLPANLEINSDVDQIARKINVYYNQYQENKN
jgi:hypothetical protein